MAWNVRRVLCGHQSGGYQYSPAFLEGLWSPFSAQIGGATVFNLFQLFPPSVIANPSVRKIPYIDLTLKQLFEEYGIGRIVGARIASEALELEREGYHASRWVVPHSRWAAESVHHDYGVPWSRIRVIVPGANLDAATYGQWQQESLGPDRFPSGTLRLVFVGKEWHRKGLDRLLSAIRSGRRLGLDATLTVIGCSRESLPQELRDVEGVTWAGFIDKALEPRRFISLVRSADAGCLFSRAEAGGISVREFHALGLPVLGTSAGGTRDHMFPDASVEIPVDADADELGHILLSLNRDPERLLKMRRAAWRNRTSALWDATWAELAKVAVAQ